MIKKLCIIAFMFASVTINTMAQTPGNSLHFDGVNDQVNAALPVVFTNIAANDFTIEAWVYPQGATFSRIVFAQYNATNFAALSTSSTNGIYFYVCTGGTTYSISTLGLMPINQWTHVAARWTASTMTPEVYFDGVLQAGSNGGTSSTGTNNMLSIGTRPGGFQYFTGQLDEVRIWNTSRSTCEIVVNKNSSLTGTEPNLVCYYNFNHGVAGGTNTGVTTLTDLVAANNGTLTNFALIGGTSNWLASNAVINNVGSGTDTIVQTQNATICSGDNYTFPDGSTQYNITSLLIDTSFFVTSVTLCDSIIVTTINVTTVDISVVQNGIVLTANATGTYQWLDCDNSYAVIPGETNQSYTPLINGNYAVEINAAGCTDTSLCVNITGIGIVELNSNKNAVYPNPNNGEFYVSTSVFDSYISVYSIDGREILSNLKITSPNQLVNIVGVEKGMYFVKVLTMNQQENFRIIVE